jgi:hypothetical protein
VAENLVTGGRRGRPPGSKNKEPAAKVVSGPFQKALEGQKAEEVRLSNRAAIIQQACKQILALEAERKAVSSELAEVKAKLIKGDLAMKIADFNTLLRLYKLERDDRDQLIDVLREGFRALGIGESVDFIAAMEKTPVPTPTAQEDQQPAPAAA